MNILVMEINEIHHDALVLLKQKHRIFYSNQKINNEIIEAILIRTYTKADKSFLKNFPNIKYILRAGVGLDNIDLYECKKRNIQVINSPGSNANSVAELVVGLMILLNRKLLLQCDSLEKGKWRDKTYLGSELKGKTIGIVGCGAIGKLIAKKLHHFDVQTLLGYDPYLTEEQLHAVGIAKTGLMDLIRKANVITLHLPLTPETKNIISLKEMKEMKQEAILINTSRGGIVKEKDLIFALKNKVISGAALDVFEDEPDYNKDLLNIPNLILTPHIGAFTQEADRQMSVDVVNRFLDTINK